MEKRPVALIFSLSVCLVLTFASANQVAQCSHTTTVKDLLKLAGIGEIDLASYAAKLKNFDIDQYSLVKLNLHQLHLVGITNLGDRIKIYNFFSKDPNDCSITSCQNQGTCRDGFRCFSCLCDLTKAYGQSCEHSCPCLNGGVCKTLSMGTNCTCPVGYAGNLCQRKYLNEDKLLKMEGTLNQVTIIIVLIRRDKFKPHKHKRLKGYVNNSGRFCIFVSNV